MPKISLHFPTATQIPILDVRIGGKDIFQLPSNLDVTSSILSKHHRALTIHHSVLETGRRRLEVVGKVREGNSVPWAPWRSTTSSSTGTTLPIPQLNWRQQKDAPIYGPFCASYIAVVFLKPQVYKSGTCNQKPVNYRFEFRPN